MFRDYFPRFCPLSLCFLFSFEVSFCLLLLVLSLFLLSFSQSFFFFYFPNFFILFDVVDTFLQQFPTLLLFPLSFYSFFVFFFSYGCGPRWRNYLSCLKNAELIDEDDPETDKVIETLQKQCVLFSGVKVLLKELTVDKIESICKLATQVFSNSVCTLTKLSDFEDARTITPPWGLFGLGYSLRDCSFTRNNYLSHHALGTLAAQLVRRGMLAAATEGEVDHGSHGDADQQQPQAVDAKLE